MSRFDFDGSDYEEMFPNQGALWHSNLTKAIKGRRGQRDLRTLEQALLELPQKRLIHGRLAKGNEVCAVAAYVVQRRVDKGEEREGVLAELRAAVRVECEVCWHYEDQHGENGCQRCAELLAQGNQWHVNHGVCGEFVDSESTDDYGDVTAQVGKRAGMTQTLAWQIGYMNDATFASLTPEGRYEAVLDWVREQLEPVAA